MGSGFCAILSYSIIIITYRGSHSLSRLLICKQIVLLHAFQSNLWILHLRGHRGQANVQNFCHTISICVHCSINLCVPWVHKYRTQSFCCQILNVIIVEIGCQLTWFSQNNFICLLHSIIHVHMQVRDIHTSVRKTRVSILNVVEPTSKQGGLKYVSQSIQSHLLGLKGNRQYSRIRPEIFCKILPFGVSNLAKQKQGVESLQTQHFSTNGLSGSQAVDLKDFTLTEVRPYRRGADLLEPRTVPEASGLQVLL